MEEHARVRNASKGNQTDTGTIPEKEAPGDDKVKEYEKSSYIHGTKDNVVGSLKVNIWPLLGFICQRVNILFTRIVSFFF